MDGLWVLITIAGVLVAACIRIGKKKKIPAVNTESEHLSIDSLTYFNQLISLYNDVSSAFCDRSDSLWDEISAYNDEQAAILLKKFTVAFKKSANCAADSIEKAKNAVFSGELEEYFILEYDIENYLKEMEGWLRSVYHIYVQDETTQKVDKTTAKAALSFFEGCSSKTEITARYKLLAKTFHPDSGCEDKELFIKMQQEYEKLKCRFGR